MKDYLIRFIIQFFSAAIAAIILITLGLSDFLTGYFSCMVGLGSLEIYDYYKNKTI